MILEIVFWLLVFLILYTYLGYPLMLLILSIFINNPSKKASILPSVSLIIAAYNEEKVIEKKILNSLNLDYPNLEIIIVSDGSTDKTNQICKKYSKKINFIEIKQRSGKINALNTAVPIANGDIVLFSDANTFYNKDVVKKLVRHFNDPKVGCVTGHVKLIPQGKGTHESGESFYSKYEQFIQIKESQISSMIGVDGAMYAMRKHLYHKLPNMFIEDFVMGMNIIKQGYRVIYDKEAKAIEESSSSIKDEIRRKSRVVAGGFQSLPKMFFLMKHPIELWQFKSHKLLRWLIPELLIALFIINIFLLNAYFFKIVFLLQMIFYLSAILGIAIRPLRIPYYFLIMNITAFWGFIKYIFKLQKITWKKANR